MNNKGFAITGILYTIFVLFMLIIGAILANISFKNRSLTLATSSLEDDFNLIKVSPIETGYTINEDKYLAKFDGKYLFELTYTINSETKKIICSTYLKKDDEIPTKNDLSLGNANPAKNFTLIPNDCNNYYYETIFTGTGGEQKMLLKEIYKFKESD